MTRNDRDEFAADCCKCTIGFIKHKNRHIIISHCATVTVQASQHAQEVLAHQQAACNMLAVLLVTAAVLLVVVVVATAVVARLCFAGNQKG